MPDDEVKQNFEAQLVCALDKVFQIVQRTEFLIDIVIIHDVVTAVLERGNEDGVNPRVIGKLRDVF